MFENDDEFDEDAVVVQIFMHIIFATKGRRPLIVPELQGEMWDCLTGIATQNGMEAFAIGGTENHVHILTSQDVNLSVDQVIELYKTGSVAWANDEVFPAKDFAWQENCAAFSVSAEDIPRVSRFIHRQATYHKRITFEREFLSFLDRHGIEYDPDNVFD